MSLPGNLGVELDFALAFVYPPSVPLPDKDPKTSIQAVQLWDRSLDFIL